MSTYLKVLPISRHLNRTVDLVVLLVSNNILLLPILLTLMNILFSNPVYTHSLLRLSFLLISILSFQINILLFSIENIALTILANVTFFYAIQIAPGFIAFLLQMICFMLVAISLAIKAEYSWLYRFSGVITKYKIFNGLRPFARSPILQIYIATLFRNVRLATTIRLLLCFIIMLICIKVLSTGALNNHITYISYAALTFCTFLISGLFVTISRERNKYLSYLNTLPCSRVYWPVRDIFFLGVILVVINIIYNVLLAITHIDYNAIEFILLVVMQISLLFVLYYTQRKWDAFGSFISIIISAIWVFAPFIIRVYV